MKGVFGDTVYFLALLSATDQHHRKAMELSARDLGPMVTTEWILTEVGDGLSQVANRARFLRLLDILGGREDVEIVASDRGLFERGCELYRQRPDKEWSLTDCISFVVMEDLEITDALTSDHHFEQAGFRALFND